MISMKTLSAAVLGIGLTVGGCSEMSDTSRRTLSGAGAGAAGGAVIGSLTGDFGWGALIGAGVGAAGGYLYDQHKQDEQAAYQRGLQEGRPAPR